MLKNKIDWCTRVVNLAVIWRVHLFCAQSKNMSTYILMTEAQEASDAMVVSFLTYTHMPSLTCQLSMSLSTPPSAPHQLVNW